MAFRILMAVNYSAGENVDGDSGFAFTVQLVTSLVASDPDLHFYVLVPKAHAETWLRALAHKRITAIPISFRHAFTAATFSLIRLRFTGDLISGATMSMYCF
jgi:hypothetical protein